MNPAGFLFGPNATMNVGGMVAFTSADYLRLRRWTRVSIAIPESQADALLERPGRRLRILRLKSGSHHGSRKSIVRHARAEHLPGRRQHHSAVRHARRWKRFNRRQLSAPGGQINLASVASPGEILTGTLAQAPNINGQSFGNLGADSDYRTIGHRCQRQRWRHRSAFVAVISCWTTRLSQPT